MWAGSNSREIAAAEPTLGESYQLSGTSYSDFGWGRFSESGQLYGLGLDVPPYIALIRNRPSSSSPSEARIESAVALTSGHERRSR